MIEVLGKKRIVVLLALLVVNLVFGGIVYGYFAPEQLKQERNLRSVRGQISTLSADIQRLQVEFEQIEEQQGRFALLTEEGFFSRQRRSKAEEVFEQIQKQSRVISAKAAIGAGTVVENAEAEKANHKILTSPASVKIEALDDIDVFRYVYLLQKYFPGHVSIENLTLKRDRDVSGTLLRSVASGRDVKMVSAKLDFTWRTMIPVSEVITPEGGN